MTTNTRPSLALSISPVNGSARNGMALVDRLTLRPPGSPAQYLVACGLQASLQAAIRALGDTDSRPADYLQSAAALTAELEAQMHNSDQVESLRAANGLKSKFPGWSALSTSGTGDHALAQTYMGLKILESLHCDQPLKASACSRLHAIFDGQDFALKQVQALLTEPTAAGDDCPDWVGDLQRTYRKVLRAYMADSTPPEPSGRSRVTGQLLDSVLGATAARRAGATNHRELSAAQMKMLHVQVAKGIGDDTLTGCLGAMVGITGFSPDLVIDTPLFRHPRPQAEDIYLDLDTGILYINHSSLVREAAASQAGCLPASLVCVKPLPVLLHQNLLKRLAQHPHATTLADLFPEASCPAGDEAVYPTKDMIRPSWARYRNSVGTYLRMQGFDNLLASVISGRFWHVPKSKMYYMVLPRNELQAGFDRFYTEAGWGEAVPLGEGSGFGSQVVPSIQAVRTHDQALLAACIDVHPGKHAGISRLLEHHNRFMRLVGFRLSCLLALRESTELNVPAAMDERHDLWVTIYDKDVLHPLPMPIAHFTGLTVSALRVHCRALRKRLITLGEGKSALASWCLSVINHGKACLLLQAHTPERTLPLSTREFLKPLDGTQRLPPDFGRKLMENELRRQGLRSTEIDAFLRHAVEGQSQQCSTAHQQCQATWSRTRKAVDRVAGLCFEAVAHGLAKE